MDKKKEQYDDLRNATFQLNSDACACSEYDTAEDIYDIKITKLQKALWAYKKLRKVDYSNKVSDLYNDYYTVVEKYLFNCKHKICDIKNNYGKIKKLHDDIIIQTKNEEDA